MSATGRGGALLVLPGLEREVGRHPDDFYRTPGWAVDLILPHLYQPEAGPRSDNAPWFCDPGCGDGAITERVLARWPNARGVGVEMDPARAREARRLPLQVFTDDFLRRGTIWEERFDLIIANPPYSLALEFAKRAMEFDGPSMREVVLLVRAGFLEAKRGSERDEFLAEHPPDVYLLAKRPRFTGDGGGDSATYIWAVWRPGSGNRFMRLRAPEAA